MRFSKEEEKLIAEFYVKNYGAMSGRNQSAEINKYRSDLLKKLTKRINGVFMKTYTEQQIHDKVKNLKKGTKEKYQESKKGK
jgi:hypothetical protein